MRTHTTIVCAVSVTWQTRPQKFFGNPFDAAHPSGSHCLHPSFVGAGAVLMKSGVWEWVPPCPLGKSYCGGQNSLLDRAFVSGEAQNWTARSTVILTDCRHDAFSRIAGPWSCRSSRRDGHRLRTACAVRASSAQASLRRGSVGRRHRAARRSTGSRRRVCRLRCYGRTHRRVRSRAPVQDRSPQERFH